MKLQHQDPESPEFNLNEKVVINGEVWRIKKVQLTTHGLSYSMVSGDERWTLKHSALLELLRKQKRHRTKKPKSKTL